MITKEAVLQVVKNLPDRFSLDELIEQVILIEKGIVQSDNN